MQSEKQHHLSAKHILSVRCAAPQILRVISGQVWITQSHDAVDHFLKAGESMLLRSDRCVIEAQLDSHFRVANPPQPKWHQRWHHHVASAFAQWGHRLWPG